MKKSMIIFLVISIVLIGGFIVLYFTDSGMDGLFGGGGSDSGDPDTIHAGTIRRNTFTNSWAELQIPLPEDWEFGGGRAYWQQLTSFDTILHNDHSGNMVTDDRSNIIPEFDTSLYSELVDLNGFGALGLVDIKLIYYYAGDAEEDLMVFWEPLEGRFEILGTKMIAGAAFTHGREIDRWNNQQSDFFARRKDDFWIQLEIRTQYDSFDIDAFLDSITRP